MCMFYCAIVTAVVAVLAAWAGYVQGQKDCPVPPPPDDDQASKLIIPISEVRDRREIAREEHRNNAPGGE